MKTTTKLFLAALAISAAVSCAKEFDAAQTSEQLPEGYKMVTLNANFEDLSKAASLGSDLSVTWQKGDSIALFDGVSTTANKFLVASVTGTSAVIYGPVSEEALLYTAVYPYTAAKSLNEGQLTLNIPETQTIESGKNIDGKALVSVARTMAGSTLGFNNAVSLVKFTVSGETSNVVISGNASEKFIGTCTQSEDTLAATGSKLTVKAAEGALAAGDYYAAICPKTFQKGITAAVVSSEGVFVKKSENKAEFKQNGGLVIGNPATGASKVPTTIASKKDLILWASYSNFFAAGTDITLTSDIDLDGVKWVTPSSFAGNFDGKNHRIYNFTAESKDTYNVGLFGNIGDGTNAAVVKNICIGSKDYNFDTKIGTYDGKSKMTVNNATNAKVYAYGGVIAYLKNGAQAENVVNFAEVEATNECTSIHVDAGVVGTMYGTAVVKDCINYGIINDNCTNTLPDSSPMGGVVGETLGDAGKVVSCFNYGAININGKYTNGDGGVIGRIKGATTVENCENHGAININLTKAQWGSYYGGITGYCPGAATIKNCKNCGEIATYDTNLAGIGGVVGCTNNASVTFENCENKAHLYLHTSSGNNNSFGGIVGYLMKAKSVIGCKNNGEMTADCSNAVAKNIYIGGIIGNVHANAAGLLVSDCHNYKTISTKPTGNVTTTSTNTAGIIAYNNAPGSTIEGCSNEGNLIKTGKGVRTNIAGIVAYANVAQAKESFINNCTNSGSIISSSEDTGFGFISGIVGFSGYNCWLTCSNCSNSGEISVNSPLTIPSNLYLGASGIIGYMHGAKSKVIDCTNTGKITPCTTSETSKGTVYVGGILSRPASNAAGLENCVNSGDIYCDPGSDTTLTFKIGGVWPGEDDMVEVKSCSNTGNITVENCADAATTVGSFMGKFRIGTSYTGENKAGGSITVNAVSEKISVGGLFAMTDKNASADKTYAEGSVVDVTIQVPEKVKPRTGMVVGLWNATGDTKTTSIGSNASPVKVKGSINGTDVTAGNLATMVQGSANVASDYHVVNAILMQ